MLECDYSIVQKKEQTKENLDYGLPIIKIT